MDKIPFADLYDGIEPLFAEYMEKIGSLIKGTEFIGAEVEPFEAEFAAWTGAKHAIGTSNGTDSLIIALKALGIGPGDKVLVPANTFIATSEAATMVGAEVDFIDSEAEYYAMDPAGLEAYLASPKGKNVKAVIPVHLHGQMADMPAIARIARARGVRIIEDAAQAHGARLGGKGPGAYGDLATYSFYPGKNIGAFGDAGAITTDDPELYKACKMLVNHGRWKAKYEHEIEGYNMRLDSMQAAVLRIKLRHIDAWTKERKARAAEYIRLLAGKAGVAAPLVRQGAEPVWHVFPIRVGDRDAVQARLREAGIATGVHYPIPLPHQPAYRRLGYSRGDFPNAERHALEELSLPIWPEMPMADVAKVVAAL
jgi:dTDP-4-amino-4,6-dideoxygalactose transaminase